VKKEKNLSLSSLCYLSLFFVGASMPLKIGAWSNLLTKKWDLKTKKWEYKAIY